MKKIAIYNYKGGVGKTTSVINIAYFLQKQGKKVLVIDCDMQKNLFGFFMQNGNENLYNTSYENIKLRLYNGKIDVEEDYDFVLFDLPPSLTDDVKSILKTSDIVFVPIKIGAFEVQGLQNVTAEIQKQGVKLGGIFVTMFNKSVHEEKIKEFKSILGNRLLESIIPFSQSVCESQNESLTIEEYFNKRNTPDIGNTRKVANSYSDLTNEILRKCEQN